MRVIWLWSALTILLHGRQGVAYWIFALRQGSSKGVLATQVGASPKRPSLKAGDFRCSKTVVVRITSVGGSQDSVQQLHQSLGRSAVDPTKSGARGDFVPNRMGGNKSGSGHKIQIQLSLNESISDGYYPLWFSMYHSQDQQLVINSGLRVIEFPVEVLAKHLMCSTPLQ